VIDWNVSRLDVFSSDAATLVATLRRSTLSFGIDATAIANARLIAAAPDLLAFAQEFLSDYQSEDGMLSMKHYAKMAYEAIAKATGEPHA
jgi:hypothetical protein